MKIIKWIRSGELDSSITTKEELLESCGDLLDASCSSEILGEVVFEADDGKTYVVTVEAVISEANPEYLQDEYLQDLLNEEEE